MEQIFDPAPNRDPSRTFEAGKPYALEAQGTWAASQHLFSRESVWAIRAALAAERPLLLRGESGIGKSQLARAAAKVLRVPFLSHVVNERSERDELLYHYDALARLAFAQMGKAAFRSRAALVAQLEEINFICPGVLWWAYSWKEAEKQAGLFNKHCRKCPVPEANGWEPDAADNPCGPVVLIDEIDKADPSVPNGLLESLGNKGFTTPQLGRSIPLAEGAKLPLVIITTNEERELPAAFLRRCLVFQMKFPDETNPAEVEAFLIRDRARVFWKEEQVSDQICRQVIDGLLRDRVEAHAQSLPMPGAAEFLDIVRVLAVFHPGNEKAQEAVLGEIRPFAFQKNLVKTR